MKNELFDLKIINMDQLLKLEDFELELSTHYQLIIGVQYDLRWLAYCLIVGEVTKKLRDIFKSNMGIPINK